MPIVHISLTDAWTADEAHALSDKVHEALVEAFKIPDHDYIHRVHRSDERSSLILSPTKSVKTVIIEMSIFPGRSSDAKAALYRGIAERLAAFGVEPRDILIALHELPLENWGVRGQPADRIDLGFSTRV